MLTQMREQVGTIGPLGVDELLFQRFRPAVVQSGGSLLALCKRIEHELMQTMEIRCASTHNLEAPDQDAIAVFLAHRQIVFPVRVVERAGSQDLDSKIPGEQTSILPSERLRTADQFLVATNGYDGNAWLHSAGSRNSMKRRLNTWVEKFSA